MSEGMRWRAMVVVLLVATLSAAGCAVKKKVVEPQVEEEVVAEKVEGIAEEAPAAVEEEVEGAGLSPEERRRIEEEELARERVEAEAAEALEKFKPEDIYFAFDRWDLSEGAREKLVEIADWMERLPAVKLRIEGHADERGTSEYNLALGEKRADAAMRYLVSLGVERERLSTISYGEEMPADPGHNEEAWAKNRRVHFVVITP